MTPSDLTADLQAPREDEPSTLRQDIADELADHLACAVRREQLREVGWAVPTKAAAENDAAKSDEWWAQPTLQRVLARFGNPRAVARKLWWDAMRERIMKERLLTGLTVVAILACCGMAGLMWQMQSAQRDMLRESQAQNAKLLEQFQAALASLKSAPADAAPSEWNQLTVKCTYDTEDGPPAAGVKVQFRPESENNKGVPGDEQSSDASGMIDFGKVLYGTYAVSCMTSDGMRSYRNVVVRPGQDAVVKFACPTSIPPPGQVKFDFQPPESFAEKEIYYLAVVQQSTQALGELDWNASWEKFARPCYILNQKGQVLGQLEADAASRITKLAAGGIDDRNRREFLESLRKLRVSPVADQPGYSLGGQIAALKVDDANPKEETTEIPSLKAFRHNMIPLSRFHMDQSRTLKLSGNATDFWRQVAVATGTSPELP